LAESLRFLNRHAGALQHPRLLHFGRRRDHHHGVDALLAAGLEQERNVEHYDVVAARLGLRQEPLSEAAQRVHDCFEPLERSRIDEDVASGAVDGA
jgi:hypothetical protein